MDALYEAEAGQFHLALTGDTLLTRSLSCFREPDFLQLRELLRDCDAVFTNLESSLNDYSSLPHVQRPSGGTYMTTESHLIEDLRWLGINLVACGSSHADDYGLQGMAHTLQELKRARVTGAGLGRNLAQARQPGYLEGPRGRVALIAATGQYHPGSRAGAQRSDAVGHPGVNGLRRSAWYEVDETSLSALRKVGAAVGWDAARLRARNQGDVQSGNSDSDSSYNFLGTSFRVGADPGLRTAVSQYDLEEHLRQVRHARQMADYVVVSLHCHEQAGSNVMGAQRRSDVDDIADYAVEFGRACLDAGADVFAAHGPQVPLGVELYHGKPLFHGLGSFVFQLETVEVLPHEMYERFGLDQQATPSDVLAERYQHDSVGHTADRAQWEQMVAVCDWDEGCLKQINIIPIDLGFRRQRSQRGRPLVAGAEVASRVLNRVADLSGRYGTVMHVRDGIGRIAVDQGR